MKKIAISLLLLFTGNVFSQENLFDDILKQLKENHPEIIFENKIIVAGALSSGNPELRKQNIQVNKAYKAFEFAKLKGGSKGMIGVILVNGNEPSAETITLNKDKVDKAIVITAKQSELQNLNNIIFDSKGKILSKNISADIFEEVHQLITR